MTRQALAATSNSAWSLSRSSGHSDSSALITLSKFVALYAARALFRAIRLPISSFVVFIQVRCYDLGNRRSISTTLATYKTYSIGRLTPRSYVNVTLTISLSVIFLILWVAEQQPNFEVSLSWNDADDALVVTDTAQIASGFGIHAGDRLVSLANLKGDSIQLHRKFLTALPKDRRDHYTEKRAYFDDRKQLYEIVKSDPVILFFADGDRLETHTQAGRPFELLSQGFWINGDTFVKVISIGRNQVKLGIEAPVSVRILREELEAAPRLTDGQPDGLDEANSNGRSIA